MQRHQQLFDPPGDDVARGADGVERLSLGIRQVPVEVALARSKPSSRIATIARGAYYYVLPDALQELTAWLS